MANVLAIETATDACSVALLHDGQTFDRYEVAPRRHTDLVLPMVDALLRDAGIAPGRIDAVAFGAGPGSFTGVRIATSVAQGLAFAHDIPVVPISCLALLAIGAARTHHCRTVVPVMDARKGEVYAATYDVDGSLAHALVDDWIGEAAGIPFTHAADAAVVGRGAAVYRTAILGRLPAGATLYDEPAFPHARDALATAVAALAAGTAVAPELARPLYLRHAV